MIRRLSFWRYRYRGDVSSSSRGLPTSSTQYNTNYSSIRVSISLDVKRPSAIQIVRAGYTCSHLLDSLESTAITSTSSDKWRNAHEEWGVQNHQCLLECPNKAGSIVEVTIDEEHWKSEEGEHSRPRARARRSNSKIPREAKQAHNYVPPTEQRAVINRLLWTILLIGSYISCGSSISSSSIPLCWMPSGFATRELVGGADG